MSKLSKLLLALVMIFTLTGESFGGGKYIKYVSKTTVKTTTTSGAKPSTTSVYGRLSAPSYSTRYRGGVKVNTTPYGRSSYIQRTYSKGGSLQSTHTVVPYGRGGWLVR